MTPTELRECLDALRWSQRGLASALGCDERTARRWAAGQAEVPGGVAEWLRRLASFHADTPAPQFWKSR
ncbi:hypothetical protein AD940_14340 [Gluconobacter thailandicus]|nr:hypothetical protein AD940_14340 [Gluconobacter thailandicus]